MSKFHETLKRMEQLPKFVWGHAFSRKDTLDENSEKIRTYTNTQVDPTEANLITSRALDVGKPDEVWGEDYHRPVLDIDFDAALVPSSTPGHYHLFLDKPMLRSKYETLLYALTDAGIIQEGFRSTAAGSELGSAVRVPWVKKGDEAIAQAGQSEVPSDAVATRTELRSVAQAKQELRDVVRGGPF